MAMTGGFPKALAGAKKGNKQETPKQADKSWGKDQQNRKINYRKAARGS